MYHFTLVQPVVVDATHPKMQGPLRGCFVMGFFRLHWQWSTIGVVVLVLLAQAKALICSNVPMIPDGFHIDLAHLYAGRVVARRSLD